jgi:hypothetical protein
VFMRDGGWARFVYRGDGERHLTVRFGDMGPAGIYLSSCICVNVARGQGSITVGVVSLKNEVSSSLCLVLVNGDTCLGKYALWLPVTRYVVASYQIIRCADEICEGEAGKCPSDGTITT